MKDGPEDGHKAECQDPNRTKYRCNRQMNLVRNSFVFRYRIEPVCTVSAINHNNIGEVIPNIGTVTSESPHIAPYVHRDI